MGFPKNDARYQMSLTRPARRQQVSQEFYFPQEPSALTVIPNAGTRMSQHERILALIADPRISGEEKMKIAKAYRIAVSNKATFEQTIKKDSSGRLGASVSDGGGSLQGSGHHTVSDTFCFEGFREESIEPAIDVPAKSLPIEIHKKRLHHTLD
jgi:hypothetical protein